MLTVFTAAELKTQRCYRQMRVHDDDLIFKSKRNYVSFFFVNYNLMKKPHIFLFILHLFTDLKIIFKLSNLFE